MGNNESKTENKAVDTNGNVNNNIVVKIEDEVNTYGSEIILLLAIIGAIKILEFVYFLYREHNRKLKRKYGNNKTTQIV